MELTLSHIQRLPKTDLHVHLDGSLRLSTMLELAEEQNIELPADTPEALDHGALERAHAFILELVRRLDRDVSPRSPP